jgi:Putative auto-transporter adhesin, head GIN domain
MKPLALLFFAVAAPTLAAERSLTLTDFDRIHVEGGLVVEVRTGLATSGRIIGTQVAIEAASVEVQGRQLNIRRSRSGWGGYPGQVPPAATVRVTVPALSNIWVSGPAKVSVDRLKGLRVSASLEGPGALSIASIAADRMDIGALGAGTLTLGGTVGNLTASLRGAGTFNAGKLAVSDLKLTSESAGDATIVVKRAANVTMTGTGSVTVLGTPACTVKNTGSGTVTCGSDQTQR